MSDTEIAAAAREYLKAWHYCFEARQGVSWDEIDASDADLEEKFALLRKAIDAEALAPTPHP